MTKPKGAFEVSEELEKRQEQWRKTLKEHDDFVHSKRDAREAVVKEKLGPSNQEYEATQELEAALRQRKDVREEMSRVAQEKSTSCKSEYEEVAKKYGEDSREAQEALKRYQEIRREERELRKDLQKSNSRTQ